MALSKLRVRARSGLAWNYDLAAQGIKRAIGQNLVPHPDAPNGHAFVHTGETVEVSNRQEHRMYVKDGALWAADEETAREVFGAKWRENFDSSFGTAPTPLAPSAYAAKTPTEPPPAADAAKEIDQ